jgi:hypothetical protein
MIPGARDAVADGWRCSFLVITALEGGLGALDTLSWEDECELWERSAASGGRIRVRSGKRMSE